MRTTLSAILLWCTVVDSRSFYWPGTASAFTGQRPEAMHGHSHDLSTIFEKASQLESYIGKNDCFQRAAGTIQVHCGQLDMDEGERIKAAIEMTLCELATANHSPPLECVSLTVDTELAEDNYKPRLLNSCVEALSRSAQYWSSYSGYLRDVPQLCHAFRRWHDIDVARETYRNATVEFVSLMRAMQGQIEENHAIRSELDDLLQGVKRIFADINASHIGLTHTSETVSGLTVHLVDQTATMFRESTTVLLGQLDRNSRLAAQQMSVTTEAIFKQHAAALSALVPDLGGMIQHDLSHIMSDVALQHQQIQLQTRSIEAGWNDLSLSMASMQDSVMSLIAGASEAATHLAVHSSQAAVTQRAQQEVMQSTVNLAISLGELSNRTREEIQAINETAFAIQEELVSARQGYAVTLIPPWWSEWMNCGTMWILRRIFGDQPNIASLMHPPIVRLGEYLLHLAWLFLRASFSSVMSSVLLALSLKRWLSTSVLLWSKPSSTPGTSGTVHLPPQTLVLPPSRFTTSLSAHTVPLIRYDNGSRRRRFSRIPERLLGPL